MIIPGNSKEIIQSLILTNDLSLQFLLDETGLSQKSFKKLMNGQSPKKKVDEELIHVYCLYQLFIQKKINRKELKLKR